MEPKDRLQQARIDAGFPKAADAARAHRSINQHTLTSNENGNRDISKKMAVTYAEAFGVSAAWLLYGTLKDSLQGDVPLRGKVGAGSEVFIFEEDSSAMDYVEAPPNSSPQTGALQVDGDSMYPVYEDRELIYYSSNAEPSSLVNRKCVVKLGDGRIFVKILRPGMDGLWNLESVNPAYPTMTDCAVEWVAKIDWTKPR